MTRERTGVDTPTLQWFKSSYSGSNNNDCVEVALATGEVLVRDSKDTALPSLAMKARAWADFVAFATAR